MRTDGAQFEFTVGKGWSGKDGCVAGEIERRAKVRAYNDAIRRWNAEGRTSPKPLYSEC